MSRSRYFFRHQPLLATAMDACQPLFVVQDHLWNGRSPNSFSAGSATAQAGDSVTDMLVRPPMQQRCRAQPHSSGSLNDPTPRFC